MRRNRCRSSSRDPGGGPLATRIVDTRIRLPRGEEEVETVATASCGGPMDPSHHGGAAIGGSGDGHGQISLWDWTGEHSEPNDESHADATKFVWDCLNQDDDELLGLLGNQTPLRDCRDFFADLGDITCKETLDLEESRESKRRRTLEYPSESSQSEVGTHDTSSPFITSEVTEIPLLCTDKPQSLNCDMQHTSNNLDTMNSLSNEAPYQQEDDHLEHCSYGTPVYLEPDQMPCSQESVTCINDQAGISGTSGIAPMTENFIMQETRRLSTLKVSKGASSSLVKVKENLTTTVAYPFTLIKPSWEEGDVTLQDINKRIRAPPKKAPEILGTSAFSGKPVIGKTRIRTDGGKGSITILRTKG